jgi:NAD-dependent SIR2 family protein deacetylase
LTSFPKAFIDAISAKECVLFIGAGISVWSGLPNWRQLIEQMLDFQCRYDLNQKEKAEIEAIIHQGNLILAASLCRSRMENRHFREFIDNIFITSNSKPREIHDMIVSLGHDSFITTNYDSLIQQAYQRIFNGERLFQVNNNQPIEEAKS